VPQIDGASLRLAYYNADSVISQWVYGEWIIKNPLWYDWSLDVCLIPWLAFDRQCNRLGHGKWYYDRFLAANTCFRIGVGYRESIIEKIPCDKWDQTMDIVIS
jgi:5-formyltetrahydrofolate cyclo-ligase